MHFINNWREGEQVSEIFLCKSKVVGKTKSGGTYYSLVLQDRSGTADGKVWNLSSGIDHFEALQYIKVDGEVVRYQNNLQLNIRRLRVAHSSEFDPADFVPMSPFPVDAMYDELLALIRSVKNDSLRALLESFFVKDAAFAKAFKLHSAAKTIHHGFSGGLLQHTLRVAQLCDFLAGQYPNLNRDLLLTAAICHDIGKTRELSAFPANDYTDEGQLIGHIVIGYEMVAARCREIPQFPEVTKNELLHLILSHHGEFEFGSPKKPALLEAFALHFADETDAKLELVSETLDGAPAGGWLGFQKLLDSNLRKTESK